MNFMSPKPIQECEYYKQAALTHPPFTTTFPDDNQPRWKNIIGAIVPTVIAVCLVSTCYICYR